MEAAAWDRRPGMIVTNHRRPTAVAAVAAGATFAGAAAGAAAGVSAVERKLFEGAYAPPAWVDTALWAPMQLGNAIAPVVVGAGAWLAWRDWRPTAGSIGVGLSAWWLAKGVKVIVERGRPAAELPGVTLRSSAPVEGLGFVSGHTTVAFALATVLRPYQTPSWRAASSAAAATVAFARVHVGAHLPLDVVGGAALGILLGSAWNLAVGSPAAVDHTQPVDGRTATAALGGRAELSRPATADL
jgi:undecaprenyl-diphosphatase